VRLLLLVTACLLFSVAPLRAEYYTYIDSQGNAHFTDNPSSIPERERTRAERVDVDMEPERKAVRPSPDARFNEVDLRAEPSPGNVKRAKKIRKSTGSPPVATSSAGESHEPPSSRPQEMNPQEMAPDPALSSPLKTIRHFRRSLARGDYVEAARCLNGVDPGMVQAFLSQMPPDFVKMLVEDLSPAVEIARDDTEAVYMLGDPQKSESKVWRRHDVQLVRFGPNWKIVR
jgi:hypothetical protein